MIRIISKSIDWNSQLYTKLNNSTKANNVCMTEILQASIFFNTKTTPKEVKIKKMVKTDSHKINQLTSLQQNNDTRKLYYTMTKPTRMNKRAIWIAYVNGGVNQNRLQTRTASYHVPRITQALLTAGKRDHRKRCGLKSWHWTWKDLRKTPSRCTLIRSEGHSIYEWNTWSVQYKQSVCN